MYFLQQLTRCIVSACTVSEVLYCIQNDIRSTDRCAI